MTNPNPNPISPAAAAAQQAALAAQQAAAAAQQAAERSASPHREPDDTEEIYYEGSPLARGALSRGLLWVFIGLVVIAAGVAALVYHHRLSRVPWYVPLAVVVIGLILFLVPVIQSKTIRYRISNYRIDFERGLLGKDIDTMELWHVEDVRFHQSLLDRILGVGTITVISHDDVNPTLVMHSIPHSRPLFEQLKQRIIAVKRSRGVIKVDPGQ